ncbi:MAG: sulfurtransferase [Proteobacteria bacterium]|nr:sulfurtransferase [Pseudomonadota bacterium]
MLRWPRRRSALRFVRSFLQAGHENVRILDGGLPEWIKHGNPVSTHPSALPQAGDFASSAPLFRFVDKQEVSHAIETGDALIIDARSEERFNGLVDEPRPGLARGHIPGACSIPFTKMLQGGNLKSPGELRSLVRGACNVKEKIIVYCGSGVTASIVALGLERAGYKNISVYDGSWSEWGAQ